MEQYKSHMKHCVGKEITVQGGVIEYITAGHGIINCISASGVKVKDKISRCKGLLPS
jgi:hypothetical protein